eukprot:Nk52_evm7s215 gene=Nk52_evmTU7s215
MRPFGQSSAYSSMKPCPNLRIAVIGDECLLGMYAFLVTAFGGSVFFSSTGEILHSEICFYGSNSFYFQYSRGPLTESLLMEYLEKFPNVSDDGLIETVIVFGSCRHLEEQHFGFNGVRKIFKKFIFVSPQFRPTAEVFEDSARRVFNLNAEVQQLERNAQVSYAEFINAFALSNCLVCCCQERRGIYVLRNNEKG